MRLVAVIENERGSGVFRSAFLQNHRFSINHLVSKSFSFLPSMSDGPALCLGSLIPLMTLTLFLTSAPPEFLPVYFLFSWDRRRRSEHPFLHVLGLQPAPLSTVRSDAGIAVSETVFFSRQLPHSPSRTTQLIFPPPRPFLTPLFSLRSVNIILRTLPRTLRFSIVPFLVAAFIAPF